MPMCCPGVAPDAIGPVKRSGSSVARWSVLGRWPGGAFWVVGGLVERSGSLGRWSVLGQCAWSELRPAWLAQMSDFKRFVFFLSF